MNSFADSETGYHAAVDVYELGNWRNVADYPFDSHIYFHSIITVRDHLVLSGNGIILHS